MLESAGVKPDFKRVHMKEQRGKVRGQATGGAGADTVNVSNDVIRFQAFSISLLPGFRLIIHSWSERAWRGWRLGGGGSPPLRWMLGGTFDSALLRVKGESEQTGNRHADVCSPTP